MQSNLRFLYSYEYIRNSKDLLSLILSMSPKVKTLIDCGAFSAWKIGSVITLKEYDLFCRQVHGKVWQYIMLDVIANPEASWQNWIAMKEAGLTPMPVWVEGMSIDRAMQMVQVNPYICVPGGTSHQDKYIWQRFQQVSKATAGHAKIHALGFTRFPDCFQLPLYSGDSSTFSTGQRFGKLTIFTQRDGFRAWTAPALKLHKVPELNAYASRCGITDAQTQDPTTYSGGESFLSMQMIHGYLQYNAFSTAKKFNFFFAITDTAWTFKILAVYANAYRDYFDYHQSRALFVELKRLWMADRPQCLQRVHAILDKGSNL